MRLIRECDVAWAAHLGFDQAAKRTGSALAVKINLKCVHLGEMDIHIPHSIEYHGTRDKDIDSKECKAGIQSEILRTRKGII